MELLFCNENNKEYQYKLNKLLKDVFLDFQFWYDLNLWNEEYESYSFIEDGDIVSNICVYKTQILFEQKIYNALSIGAVATKKEYRNRGLSRRLMEHIIEKYGNIPMYLSANEGVINFYPKFGFKNITEKLPVCEYEINNDISINKLKYNNPRVWNYIHKRVNYSHKLDCLNTKSINIFHIYWGYLRDLIYELSEINTMVIAKQEGTTLNLIGVFSLREISFSELVKHLPFNNVKNIEFGFMPYWNDIDYIMKEYKTDPIFVRGVSCDLGDFKFPELSIT